MRLTFNINEYDKGYDALVRVLGFEQECFQTYDVIEVYWEDLDAIRNILPDVEVKKINNTLDAQIISAENKRNSSSHSKHKSKDIEHIL